MRNRISQAGMT